MHADQVQPGAAFTSCKEVAQKPLRLDSSWKTQSMPSTERLALSKHHDLFQYLWVSAGGNDRPPDAITSTDLLNPCKPGDARLACSRCSAHRLPDSQRRNLSSRTCFVSLENTDCWSDSPVPEGSEVWLSQQRWKGGLQS